MKEFKITCQGCNNIRFVPYFEFTEHTSSQKKKGFLTDLFTSIGLGVVCLPLGCCSSLASVDGVNARNRTPEEKREKYFELQKVDVCNKCGSLAKKVEIITHNLDEIR
ncbi:hypothetical protein FLACOL_01580 [Flavobacterium columnare]|uniref:Uncharacterized protein n=2 Tax=Flavobacterium TaxID=237 RepID=A0ABW8PLF7_9FLAO|nr:hypothetical protein [Flavobacterium columnare]SPE77584.1 hypothetical protein FLACOL_01580 [Flavobacterium columnare]